MPRLFHISENADITTFIPRRSKKQWNYAEYVWAIEEKKRHHYLLPRDCPRICIDVQQLPPQKDWLPNYRRSANGLIYVPNVWRKQIEQTTLYQYEFVLNHFELIDQIAGYYVSKQPETPIKKRVITSCMQELDSLNIALVFLDRAAMFTLREHVLDKLRNFSIIRWRNM